MKTVQHIWKAAKMRFDAGRQGSRLIFCFASLIFLVLPWIGCGTTAKIPSAASVGQVQTYYSGPLHTPYGTSYGMDLITLDHAAQRITVAAGAGATMGGSFSKDATGFLDISEDSGPVLGGMSLPLAGAWLAEIPGVGAFGNLLNAGGALAPGVPAASPVVMAANTSCPDFPKPVRFLFVQPWQPQNWGISTYYYGTVDIGTAGSLVDFTVNGYPVGEDTSSTPVTTTGEGGCSSTILGSVTAYPPNTLSTGSSSYPVRLSAIGGGQLLVGEIPWPSQGFSSIGSISTMGVAMLATPVDLSAVASKQYLAMLYAPSFNVSPPYDTTTLAAEFGVNSASSASCSNLQSAIAQAVQQGTVASGPSPRSLYGGDFANGVPGASGSGNCDTVLDFGTQDAKNNGLFPGARVFSLQGGELTVNTVPAIVGQAQDRYIVFFNGTYLFQKAQ